MISVMEKESLNSESTGNLHKFFYPESLVVIGVSIKRLNLGQIILTNNHRIGCKARIYGVGKEAGDLNGVPVFADVRDLPETPDVAIIITPAKTIPGVMRACAEKGIRHVVIESGGFSEYSSSSRSLEDEVLAIARQNGIRIIGPNCIGTICLEHRLMMPFVFSQGNVQPGSVSIVTQSGGVGDTLLKIVNENHVFFNKFIATGNKLDLDEVDFLEYLIQDESTKAIIMYLEGFSRGRAFFEAAMKSPKPIIVYKSNRYPMSAKIAQSHTAALSASDEVVSAALNQAAAIRVNSEDELMVAAKSLKLPAMGGKRLAVLSRSGGHAVVTVDACAQYGFELVEFPEEFLKKIGTLYNTNVIAHQNPLDLGEIFDYTIFTRILEETMAADGIDGIIFNHNYQSSYEAQMSRTFLDGVKKLVEENRRPVAVTLISDAREVLDITMNHPYPTFTMPHHSVRALWTRWDYTRRRERRDSRGLPEDYPVRWNDIEKVREVCREDERIPLTDEALVICAAAGMEPVRHTVIRGADGLRNIGLRYPVAVKLLSRDASHKTDVGGVMLNIASETEAAEAIAAMTAAVRGKQKSISIDGFLVQEMAAQGEEFFVGARRDASFGPIVMAGLGGVFIELFKDRSIRLAPVTKNEAEDMLRQLTAYPLLRGYRGRPVMDIRALTECICRVSNLITKAPYIDEIDLNPVIMHPEGQGVSIVDSRVFFR
ncbi:MAG TPA: acetate--CoA ligase family protein [Spirochaetota bacterium]|nr:acetate--CoA ligase family protein [Spirochaetota bacterium]HPC40469.1 acetate--CoA ligase family protein [Spirochaetota bacterium]HPL15792.1 acetate--CoA ligase family protein [Spirochaetota bacterium]HQF06536.1 acetate--CoA ligase family protein [Spirochaetota bacterium]HQH96061.1 acetate--CoA ligase family protein [Spirochaetota bacterium]